MKYVFRVDSGAHIGSGHVMRCLALADGLKAQGLEVSFVCKNHLHNYNSMIRQKLRVFEIDGGVQDPSISHVDRYDEWLGESWERDLEKTNNCLREIDGPKMVIVDHYALDAKFESALNCDKVFVVDELLNRKHACDILLDQNYNYPKEKHMSACGSGTEYLLGPQYALLRSSFAQHRPLSLKPLEKVKKILVFMGGTDKTHESVKILSAFLDTSLDCEMHIVLNDSNSDFISLKSMSELDKRVTVYSHMSDYDSFLTEVDLFLGAAGSSSWERACLGIASVVVVGADNQRDLAEHLRSNGWAFVLGHGNVTGVKEWQRVFSETIYDSELLNDLRSKSYSVSDGRGVERVVSKILHNH